MVTKDQQWSTFFKLLRQLTTQSGYNTLKYAPKFKSLITHSIVAMGNPLHPHMPIMHPLCAPYKPYIPFMHPLHATYATLHNQYMPICIPYVPPAGFWSAKCPISANHITGI